MSNHILTFVIPAVIIFALLSFKDYQRYTERDELRAITSQMILNAPCENLPQSSDKDRYTYQCADKKVYILKYDINNPNAD